MDKWLCGCLREHGPEAATHHGGSGATPSLSLSLLSACSVCVQADRGPAECVSERRGAVEKLSVATALEKHGVDTMMVSASKNEVLPPSLPKPPKTSFVRDMFSDPVCSNLERLPGQLVPSPSSDPLPLQPPYTTA